MAKFAASQQKRFLDFGYVEMTNIDHERNRRRYYCISLQPGLFDLILQRRWGRIGCRPQTKDLFVGSTEEAIKMANRIYREKYRKGYREVC